MTPDGLVVERELLDEAVERFNVSVLAFEEPFNSLAMGGEFHLVLRGQCIGGVGQIRAVGLRQPLDAEGQIGDHRCQIRYLLAHRGRRLRHNDNWLGLQRQDGGRNSGLSQRLRRVALQIVSQGAYFRLARGVGLRWLQVEEPDSRDVEQVAGEIVAVALDGFLA